MKERVSEKKLRALVVDDNPREASANAFVLEDEGFAVETAHSAEDAAKKLGAGRFNLVLVDKNLQGYAYGGSMELIGRLRAEHPQTHVAVMSAESKPGAATDVVFINKIDIDAFEQIVAFARKVRESPWKTGPSKGVPLAAALQRVIAIKEPIGGAVRVFSFVEGQPFPPEAERLIKNEGGTVLTLEQALHDPATRTPDRIIIQENLRKAREFARMAMARKQGAAGKQMQPRRPWRRKRRL